MIRFVAGGVSALLLTAAGFFVRSGGLGGNAAVLPKPPALAASTSMPSVDNPPAASEATREEKRFARYDRDRDGSVGREEYLASRRKAFAKLDLDHDGKLSFDEYAAKTLTRFAGADADKSGTLAPTEFATTRVVRRYTPKCPPRSAASEGNDEG